MKTAPFALAAAALVFAGCGEGSAEAGLSEERVRQIVREYLIANPELIREALVELQYREQAAEQDEIRTAALAAWDEIANDPRVPTTGPEDARVTIVEFYDYNCSYCKLASDWLRQAMEQSPGDIRVVFRDYPILNNRTGTSLEAAEAGLAAAEQGRFLEMHFGLYTASGVLTSEEIDDIAREAGVDVERMRADMGSGRYGELFADTLVLGQRIGVGGTPFFMINDQIVPGADLEQLQTLLDAALAES